MRERGRRAGVRCPICGVGVLTDIAYDEHHPSLHLPKQAPESRELLSFSCGHEVEDRLLARAERDDPNVERRTSDETMMRTSAEGGVMMSRSERPLPVPDPEPERPNPPGPIPDPEPPGPPPDPMPPRPQPEPAPPPPPDADPPIRARLPARVGRAF